MTQTSPARSVVDTGKLLAPLDDLHFPSIGKTTRVRAANRHALAVGDEARTAMESRALSDVEKFDNNARFLDHCLLDFTPETIRELTFEETELAVGYCMRKYDDAVTVMRAAEAATTAAGNAGAEGNGDPASTAETPSSSRTGTRRSRSAPSSPAGRAVDSAT